VFVDDGTTKVLIAGGGVAALEAALTLRDLAGGRVNVELLAPDSVFRYQPLSVAQPFGLGEPLNLELDQLATAIGAHRRPMGLTGIDAWRHVAHTTKNTEVPYDILLVACGALPLPAVAGATTFRGAADTDAVTRLLDELMSGDARSVAFVIPWGSVWALPAYELALLTAAHLEANRIGGVELTVVTPEVEPLQLFGPPASAAIRELLEAAGVRLQLATYAGSFSDRRLELVPNSELAIDRVLALPRLEAAPLDGIPQTLSGFIPVDEHCRVLGLEDVYAAGDVTSFPVKQGGIAAQQADAAAEAIAAMVGAHFAPRPFQPVLRGLLLTGTEPRYLRRELGGSPSQEAMASRETLWWPPAKIVGRRLAPFLAELSGTPSPVEPSAPPPGAVPVEIEVDTSTATHLAAGAFVPNLDAPAGELRVDQVMSRELVVAAPDATLGDVAEHLIRRSATAAVIVEDHRLVGILTLSDVVRASAARMQPAESQIRAWMTAEPVTVPPEWPASAAVLLMSEYRIHHVPVVHGNRVVGMLDVEDVQRASVAPNTSGLHASRAQ
jgi:sulfide:quinone oxidoreductase